MNDTEKQKAVIYTRVQHATGTERASVLASQETKCRALAQANGYVVTHIFEDTGSANSDFRPGLDDMVKFLDERRQDKYRVLMEDPSRLARSIAGHLHLRQKILEAGASIEFAERFSPQIENRARLVARERER